MFKSNYNRLVFWSKKLIFGDSENYRFAGRKLRFLIGTRPTRRKYINNTSVVVRSDVLQINYFEKEFKKDDILWDIGSCYGQYSLFVASIVSGNNQIFSFEPDADARAIQAKNIELNKAENKIKIYDYALSDRNGKVRFKSMQGNSQSRIASKTEIGGDIREIGARSIDSLLDELPKPTFIKIDTEGAEINILKGASKLLRETNVRFICELHPFNWTRFKVNFDDLTVILAKHGRKIRLLDKTKSLADLPFYGIIVF